MKCRQCGKWCQWLIDANIKHAIARRRRRVVSGDIIRRCKEIEKELPDSDDPATLRLERSELDGELEKMEATG